MNNKTIVSFTMVMLLLLGMKHAEAGVIDICCGNLSASTWGPGVASYGQTFTVPLGNSVLVDYSFSVLTMNAQFLYVSQVYAWDGSGVTGAALFTSTALLSPLPLDIFTTVVFAPSIAVTAGHQYIALVTNQPFGAPFGGPPDSGGGMFLNQDNPYSGGEFVFKDGNPEIGPWFLTLSNADAVFHADFVPEPATLVLFGLGLALLTVIGKASAR